MSRVKIDPAMKSRRSLVTPEGLDLQLKIAGTGARIGAFTIDLLIMIAAILALFFAAIAAFSPFTERGDIVAIVWMLGFFVIRSFYFMFFEMGRKSATPGKRAMKIRVANRHGGPVTASAVFARNAMRELEFFIPITYLLGAGAVIGGQFSGWLYLVTLIWALIFLLFPLFNRDHLRMGDIIGGTFVISAPKVKLSDDLSTKSETATGFVFTPEQIDAYGVKELHVLENVLRTKHGPTLDEVCKRIMKKINWDDADSYAEKPDEQLAFLNAYYKALRAKLESGLLFGKRRKDKFDTS